MKVVFLALRRALLQVKSHRELHSWWAVFAATHRLWFLHALLYLGCMFAFTDLPNAAALRGIFQRLKAACRERMASLCGREQHRDALELCGSGCAAAHPCLEDEPPLLRVLSPSKCLRLVHHRQCHAALWMGGGHCYHCSL